MSVELWANVQGRIQKRVGSDSFRHWISPLNFVQIEGQAVHFCAPSKFHADYVENHFSQIITNSFRENGHKVLRMTFEHAPQTDTVDFSILNESASQVASPAPRLLPVLEEVALDPRFRFDRFVVGKPNEMAYHAARRIAEGGTPDYNPLFLYSGVGQGKTHLMQAIAWEIKETRPDTRLMFLSAEKFMFQFVQALRQKTIQGFKETLRSVDVLLVDDVQFIAGKESTQEEFFYTFNALVEQNRQIVISADRAPGDLEGVEDRIRSRLQWGLMVDIHAANSELRLGILQDKAEYHLRNYPHVVIEAGVLEFLAQRITSNIRVLEGALTRLIAYADLSKQPVTIDTVHNVLADLLRISKSKLTLDIIIKRCAEFYNVRVSDIMGTRRTHQIVRPRQIAMYMAKSLTTKSLLDIGRSFGGRDHATVIHACKKVEDLIRHDSEIADEVETLRRLLES